MSCTIEIDDADMTATDQSAVTNAVQSFANLLTGEWPGIRKVLDNSEDDSVAIAFSVKLLRTGVRIGGQTKLSYSQKFTSDAEFITPDFDQRALPLDGGVK